MQGFCPQHGRHGVPSHFPSSAIELFPSHACNQHRYLRRSHDRRGSTKRPCTDLHTLLNPLPALPCQAPALPSPLASKISSSRSSCSSKRGHRVITHAAVSTKAPKVQFVCKECGRVHPKRQGRCQDCGAWNTLEERQLAPEGASGSGGANVGINVINRAKASNTRRKGWVDNSGSLLGIDASSSGDAWPSSSGLPITQAQSLRSLGKTRHLRPSRFALKGRTGEEVNRVLGGGVVPGSLVLVGGDPGLGKSTLLLQIAGMLAVPGLDFDVMMDSFRATEHQKQQQQQQHRGFVPGQQLMEQANGIDQEPDGSSGDEEEGNDGEGVVGPERGDGTRGQDLAQNSRRVLYVSGEEQEDQVYDRAARMGLGDCSTLYVMSESRMEVVVEQVVKLRPAALVIDSIQTMSLTELNNPMGSPIQLVECCILLKQLAREGMAVFTIGHMTKNNQIAGPKAMIHMVDVVLRLEANTSDTSGAFRMLRADKNRNGNTAEIGVFNIEAGGMRAVEDLSAQFLASRSASSVSSCALTVNMESSRPLVMEVQASVTAQPHQSQAPPLRQPTGVNRERLAPIIVNVLKKLKLIRSNQDITVSITGGLQVREPAADLAIAVAIVSDYNSTAVPRDMVVIGEIDLGGGLRPVKSLDTRLVEVAKLGIKSAVIPKPHYPEELTKLRRDPRLQGLSLMPCATLLEATRTILGDHVGERKQYTGNRQKEKVTEGRQKQTKSKSRAVIEEVDVEDEVDESERTGQSDDEEEEEDEQGEPWEKEMELA